MAQIFIVEDGSIVAGANSYVPLSFAQDYHDSAGHAVWSLFGTSVQQSSLVRATAALDKRWGLHYKGHRKYFNQTLLHPRWGMYWPDGQIIALSNVIAPQLMQATCELALRAAIIGEIYPDSVPLVPAQNFGGNSIPTPPTEYTGGMVKSISNTVDIIKQEKQYVNILDMVRAQMAKYATSTTVTDALLAEYPAADLLIQPLLHNRSSGSTRRA